MHVKTVVVNTTITDQLLVLHNVNRFTLTCSLWPVHFI